MALYKNGNALQHSQHQAFDQEHNPGVAAPNPGIYKCVNCGDEIGIAAGHTLPPQNHHQHPNKLPVKWKLLVCAIQQ